jgi:hypothetical protein
MSPYESTGRRTNYRLLTFSRYEMRYGLESAGSDLEWAKAIGVDMRTMLRRDRVEIPIDSGLIFPFAGSVLVCGREQLLL